jgi:hypothetical protein
MDDEYIRRDAAMKAVASQYGACRSPAQNRMIDEIRNKIRRMPAADVAEVVRCKDCAKHYIVLGRDMCARNAQGSEGHWIGLSATVPDGFCHRGVHK